MSWLFSGNANQTRFDEAVDSATSELLPSGSDETLLTSLQLSDQIRSKSVEAAYALKSIRRRLAHKNPNVQLQTLHVLDVLLKNSGEAFLLAVGNGKEGWMAELEDLCKSSNHDLRQTATKYIQNWALAYQSASTSSALSNSDLVQLYNRLKHNIEFPPASQAWTSSMISSLAAPEWVDSDLCQRCRTPFTLTNRKHHCRNCGGVFCGDCSSKSMKLEHLGIDQEVRVCDGCYKKVGLPGGRSASVSTPRAMPAAPATNGHVNGTKGKTQEEIDFERAIALSLAESKSSAPSDAHAKSANLPGVGYGYEARPSRPPAAFEPDAKGPSKQLEEDDPDLAAAIRASLAEPQPSTSSAPYIAAASAPPKASYAYVPQIQPSVPSYELAMSEFDALDSFGSAMRNPHIRPEDADELFYRADRHRSKMYRALEDAEVKRSRLTELNQKLQHAVRLYDSLLERKISQYNQPRYTYQQNAPQQYSHPSQMQRTHSQQTYSTYPGQHYQYTNGVQAQPHVPQFAEQNGAAIGQQNQYEPGAMANVYSGQQAVQQEWATSSYSHPQAEGPPAETAHYGASGAHVSQPEQQYYHPYPVAGVDGAEQAAALPLEQGYAGDAAYYQPQASSEQMQYQPNIEEASDTYHSDQTAQQQIVQHQDAGPPQQYASPAHTMETAVQQPHKPGVRLQGYYSASSFPAVPSVPVGGFPAAPDTEIAEHKRQDESPEKHKQEAALIEF